MSVTERPAREAKRYLSRPRRFIRRGALPGRQARSEARRILEYERVAAVAAAVLVHGVAGDPAQVAHLLLEDGQIGVRIAAARERQRAGQRLERAARPKRRLSTACPNAAQARPFHAMDPTYAPVDDPS
jgi:hypothetical protein